MSEFICKCHNKEFKDNFSLENHLGYERVKNTPEYLEKVKRNDIEFYKKHPNYWKEYWAKQENKEKAIINEKIRYEKIKNNPILWAELQRKAKEYYQKIKNNPEYKTKNKKANDKFRKEHPEYFIKWAKSLKGKLSGRVYVHRRRGILEVMIF